MKINKTYPQVHYSEMPQNNPVRFTILFKNEDGSFDTQSSEFKCKDFFNEVVAAYHGQPLGAYSFETKGMKLQDEGVWVLLTHIIKLPSFEENIRSINKLAKKDGMPEVEVHAHTLDSVVALLPRAYFNNTYLISFLSYLIRVANTEDVNPDPTWKTHSTLEIDCPFRNVFDRVMARGFKSPAIKSFYYAGKKHDHSQKLSSSHIVHNNGVASWTALMMAEGIA